MLSRKVKFWLLRGHATELTEKSVFCSIVNAKLCFLCVRACVYVCVCVCVSVRVCACVRARTPVCVCVRASERVYKWSKVNRNHPASSHYVANREAAVAESPSRWHPTRGEPGRATPFDEKCLPPHATSCVAEDGVSARS